MKKMEIGTFAPRGRLESLQQRHVCQNYFAMAKRKAFFVVAFRYVV